MKATGFGAVLSILAAATAIAHTGVENPAVLARMENMKAMADQMEVLVPMVRGEADFETSQVTAALEALQVHAAEAPNLFRAPESDPQSEALPEIWENFEDFEAQSEELLGIAQAASASQIDGYQELLPVVREIGASCSGCHEDYRADQ
jgi:cytochrome c556